MHTDLSLLPDWINIPSPSLDHSTFSSGMSLLSTREVSTAQSTYAEAQWTPPWLSAVEAKVLSLTRATLVELLGYHSFVQQTAIHIFFGDLLGIFIRDFCWLDSQ